MTTHKEPHGGGYDNVSIPKWFFRMQGTLVPVIATACVWAAGMLWSMRVELTTLNVEVRHLNQSMPELDKIRDRMQDLEKQLSALVAKTDKLTATVARQDVK